MKIISSSIERIADTFLHAGYISSAPCSRNSEVFNEIPSAEIVLEMKSALELKAVETVADSSHMFAGIISDFGSVFTIAIVTVVFFILFYLLNTFLRKFPKMDWAVSAFMVFFVFTSFFIYSSCGGEIEETDKLNSDIVEFEAFCGSKPEREYKNPHLATQAIVYGFITDALFFPGNEVKELNDLDKAIAMPTREPTEGMLYAFEHFCYDGWGNEFRFEKEKTDYYGNKYFVTSAGEDGEFDTDDDITVEVHPRYLYREQFSDEPVNMQMSIFFSKHNEKNRAIFRSLRGKADCKYKEENVNLALSVTGNSRFEAITFSDEKMEELNIDIEDLEDSIILKSFKFSGSVVK